MEICLIIGNNPFFTSSASANRWRTLIEGLLHQKVSFNIIFTRGYNSIYEWKVMGTKGIKCNYSYQYTNPLLNINLLFRRINNYILEPIIRSWINYNTVRVIKLKSPEIIWTSADISGFHFAVSLKEKGVKAKLMLEMSEFLDIHHNDKGPSVIKKQRDAARIYFEKRAFYAYDFIVLMTKTLYRYYSVFPEPKPRLLHLPMTVDLKRFDTKQNIFPLKSGLQKPYMTYIGVMNNAKDGVNILIDAFAKICKDFPDLKLYLFGFYHYDSPGHIKQIKSHGLENRVFYQGAVSRDEIPAILMNADVLVLPRPCSKQARGGFPTKLGEYLATGKPVCVTRVGEIPDYLTDNVSVFMAEPGSIDSFSDAMHRALKNKDKAIELGKNGRTIAEKYFNMDIQSKLLYDFLKANISAESQ